jgi:hypothetical protein
MYKLYLNFGIIIKKNMITTCSKSTQNQHPNFNLKKLKRNEYMLQIQIKDGSN